MKKEQLNYLIIYEQSLLIKKNNLIISHLNNILENYKNY